MTRHEFTMMAAQIAKTASSWAHETLLFGHDAMQKEIRPDSLGQFETEIRDLLELHKDWSDSRREAK